MLKPVTHKSRDKKYVMSQSHLLHLIANEMLWKKREFNASNSGQDIV